MISQEEILRVCLPEGFPIDRFDIIKIDKVVNTGDDKNIRPYLVYFHFEEKLIPPDGYTREQVISKGLSKERTIFDLPIRNNLSRVCVRSRRWDIVGTNKTIQGKLEFIEDGTRNTKELSYFFKIGKG